MKYLLTLYGDESRFADMTPEQIERSWDGYTSAVIDEGVHLGGEGLQPSATATTVKIEASGDTIVLDGPFAETREQLGGYYLLNCKDLDHALAWARRIPMPGGTVEVRPVMDYEAVGSSVHSNEAGAQARPPATGRSIASAARGRSRERCASWRRSGGRSRRRKTCPRARSPTTACA